MAENDISIEVKTCWERIKRLYDSWKSEKEVWNSADAVSFILGASDEEVVYTKSSSIQIWLFGYEFTQTIILLCEKTIFILTSQKKAKILEPITKEHEGELPPVPIELLIVSKKKEENEELMKKMLSAVEGSKVGEFLKEKQSGEIVETWHNQLKAANLTQVEISSGVSTVLAVKDAKELKTLKTAGTLTCFLFKNHVTSSLETIIDEGKEVKHSEFAQKIEKIFEDPSKINKKLTPDVVESCYPPIIQSGGKYDLKIGVEPDENTIHFGTIVCSIGARFKSYCNNIARTYFVDPTKEQEKNYRILVEIHSMLVELLKPGVKLNKLYQKAVKYIESNNASILPNFGKNCGFGIGIEFQEPYLMINAKNEAVVKPGMAFNLSLSLSNLKLTTPSDDPKKDVYSILLSDTVIITDTGNEVLTDKCPKKYSDVAYFIKGGGEQDEQQEKEKKKSTGKAKPEPKPLNEVAEIIESKLRDSGNRRDTEHKVKSTDEKRREHQKLLQEKQREAAAARFMKEKENGGNDNNVKTSLVAYKDSSELPREAQRSRIFVDNQKEAVLLPIYGLLVPFHISTIKNASKTDEQYLRINFNTPVSVVAKQNDGIEPSKIYIKELTFRVPDERNLNNSLRAIKELRKRVTSRIATEKETQGVVVQEKLQLSKGRNPRLSDIFVRPNPSGRRTTGVLEAHTNGFRFTSLKGEHIDIMYKNIKNAFFQPAENELIVLIHFHLLSPILIGKKRTLDVQFCTEVMEVSQALDSRGRYDADEIEDEQRERAMRARLNNEFQNFVRKVEEVVPGGLEFDIPYRDLGFEGVPHRSSVLLQPTVHCLVHLTEQPFFVLSLDEIEIAYFERVQFQLKNFDLVFVLKDYAKPVIHINSIAVDFLETIKEWLDSADLKYYEGTQTLNWNRIMATIREDPVKFHTEDGGWSFLNPESDDEAAGSGQDSESEAESDFAPSESEASGSDEDEDEEEEGEGEDEDEDSEEFEEEEEDEDVDDWDAQEEKFRQEDEARRLKMKVKRARGEDVSDDSEEERKKVAAKKQKSSK